MAEQRSSLFHLVLHEPVIPQNTGSIARLCACTGATLHLIHPLGFQVDEASVKRAGLDYWEHVTIENHEDWEAFLEAQQPEHFYFFSKWGEKSFWGESFVPSNKPVYLILGSETKGLPEHLWNRYPERFLKVPMRTEIVRSLNLSQCAGIVLYEALRQAGFSAGIGPSINKSGNEGSFQPAGGISSSD